MNVASAFAPARAGEKVAEGRMRGRPSLASMPLRGATALSPLRGARGSTT